MLVLYREAVYHREPIARNAKTDLWAYLSLFYFHFSGTTKGFFLKNWCFLSASYCNKKTKGIIMESMRSFFSSQMR